MRAKLWGALVALALTGCGVSPSLSAPIPATTVPTVTKTAPAKTVTAPPRHTPTAAPPTRVPPQATIPPRATPPPKAVSGTALKALAGLPVKGRAPMTGYERDKFGPAWSDDVAAQGGHNGCDTRNDVLRRDLRQVDLKPSTSGCVVLTGVLPDAYSGRTIAFHRGQATSSQVQIDHVVALGNAWATGAQQLSADRRRELGNDPLNLWAVDGHLNQQKGAGDAATWLPPNNAIRCLYVARQIAVKGTYRLWVTKAEQQAMTQVLVTCPGQPLPTAGNWRTPPPSGT